ncbi:UDP-glucose 4-epimerase GalE [Parvularcula sp. LCG005]|uniref:UDP-glucose 4-epimerase GalE n=1 Tax=Parvularcula sp. LCG005 TaxID=3078805 RepID=UPI002942A0B5|nr:UDP-glucose 4-epimerase GalE [Parvularcula sp. LCG005]WOI53632.1 UDP-glucose 4-epimerase GalE [Parvularcula sp. LCG005]
MASEKLLITGGAGYIGSHVAWAAADAGRDIIVIDDLSTGREANVPPSAEFVEGRLEDHDLLNKLIGDPSVVAVLHFAGKIIVPESVSDPIKYYRDNTCATLEILSRMVDTGKKAVLFSSTAAVYEPQDESGPLVEDAPKTPLSPYGQSKLMTEAMIRDIGIAHGLSAAILRYFNVAGADPKGRTGQSGPNSTHLIKVACQTALGQRDKLSLYGDDYPTPDGTCIRDYIHVSDLAAAHLLALDHVLANPGQVTLNCGYGRGSSVWEVIRAVEEVTGKPLPVDVVDRRPGDAPSLVADNSRIMELLDWHPQHDSLTEMASSALEWERKLNQ